MPALPSCASEGAENTVDEVLQCLLPLLRRQYDEPPIDTMLQHLIEKV